MKFRLRALRFILIWTVAVMAIGYGFTYLLLWIGATEANANGYAGVVVGLLIGLTWEQVSDHLDVVFRRPLPAEGNGNG